MRRVQTRAILLFSLLASLCLALGVGTAWASIGRLVTGELHGTSLVISAGVMVLAYALAACRVLNWLAPIREGELAPGSPEELRYNVFQLAYVVLFCPLLESSIVPLRRMLYLSLGARLGRGSYVSGTITDPALVSMGDDSVVGFGAVVVPHVIEGQRLALHPISIGSNVTIGTNAVVMAGVSIGDNAVVSAGSVVPKFSRIAPGEVWAGNPAKPLTLADLFDRQSAGERRPNLALIHPAGALSTERATAVLRRLEPVIDEAVQGSETSGAARAVQSGT